MNKRVVGVVTSLAAVAVLTSACDWTDKVTEPFKDAPRSSKTYDGPADVITMPDGFSNMATKCGPPGFRVFTSYHGDAPYTGITVVADATCR